MHESLINHLLAPEISQPLRIWRLSIIVGLGQVHTRTGINVAGLR